MTTLANPRVMISSPVKGLEEIRACAHQVCERLGFRTVSMEERKAVPESPLEYSVGLVQASDVFIGIAGQLAGSRPNDDEHTYSRMEYERAKLSMLPRLLFVLETGESAEGQEGIRELMLKDDGAVSSLFHDVQDFEDRLTASLETFLTTWRENRGLTPEHAELIVENPVVERGELVKLRLDAPDPLRHVMSVRLQGQGIELDEFGVGRAQATQIGQHSLELLFQPAGSGTEQRMIRQVPVTVLEASGWLARSALTGAFIAFATWLLLGFSHPVVKQIPEGLQAMNFKHDWLGHVLTSSAIVVALALGVVFKRARRGLGAAAQYADQAWKRLRPWIIAALVIVLGASVWLNARFVLDNEEHLWWSEELGEWAVWTISLVYFLLALGPMITLIARLGLSVMAGMRHTQAVLTYDPCASDGHFGLAWLGDTLLFFLMLASIPSGLAIAVQFSLHKQAGLGVPVAVLLGFLTIGAVVYPMFQAYASLSENRFGEVSAERSRLKALQAQPEAALLPREREERQAKIEEAKGRIADIEQASAIVAGWRGAVFASIVAASLLVPFALFVVLGTPGDPPLNAPP